MQRLYYDPAGHEKADRSEIPEAGITCADSDAGSAVVVLMAMSH